MRLKTLLLLLPFMLLLQPFSVLLAESSSEKELDLMEIIFEEIEPGIEPFKSRLLLGEFFLRLDDGDDQGDFLLFEGKTHEVHSFNHEEQSHLIMKPLTAKALDFTVDFKVKQEKLLDAPKVNGTSAVQHLFFADGNLCKKSINVSGFLPEVTQVLIDYGQAIVQQNSQTLSRIPNNVRSSCYMANNYLFASDYLKVGFPLFVSDDQGRQKKLLGFRQLKKHRSIMFQPPGYSVYFPNSANLKN
ncbi:MAG: hypothetical protein KAI17_06570 [Thiotrichaceae bacterium]|nr:hypothetical protein [Thiotrichaceae bacterium]